MNKYTYRASRTYHHKRASMRLLTTIVMIALLVGLSGAYIEYRFGVFSKLINTTKDSSSGSRDNQSASKNPLFGKTLFVDPDSNAARQASSWRDVRPSDANAMDKLAAMPTAKWFTSITSLDGVSNYVDKAKAANQLPVVVAYFIPHRDCGMYSAGGASNAEEYRNFVRTFANAIGSDPAVVILEPDALPSMQNKDFQGNDCLTSQQKDERYTLLSDAVSTLKAQPNTVVYIDAGNSDWISQPEIVDRLSKAGIAQADGFSLNVSNFQPTDKSIAYSKAVSAMLNDTHFVIDTSRNGVGAFQNTVQPSFTWCNPPNRALGHYPTTNTATELVDAFLYIKYPGESDGQDQDTSKCFGGPRAGVWWPEYALGLIERWPAALQPTAQE